MTEAFDPYATQCIAYLETQEAYLNMLGFDRDPEPHMEVGRAVWEYYYND
jgi:hypothetical protein